MGLLMNIMKWSQIRLASIHFQIGNQEALRAGEVCFFTRFGNIVKAALR